MNALSELCLSIQDGCTLTLEKGRRYHVRQDDSFFLSGYYCTNTTHFNENPHGERNAAIYLQNKRGVTINGNGASIIIHGKMTPFLLDACEDIIIKNLTIDYACPTMAEFTVLSNNGGVCDIRISPDTLFTVEGNQLYWISEKGMDGQLYWKFPSDGSKQFVHIFDPVSERSIGTGSDTLSYESIKQLDEHTLRVIPKSGKERYIPGCIFQTRNIVRDQTGAFMQRCKNLYYEDVRIKFMHGLGMVAQFCENVTYRNCDFTPGDGRTIASTADFFQFSGCRGKLVIDGCHARGAHDDFANIHGTHLRIIETSSDKRSMTLRFMHGESWGFQAFEKGDSIEFIRWDTLRPYAKAEVVSYKRLNDSDIRLDIDRDLPAGIIVDRDVIENATWTPDVHIMNCNIDSIACRGILCTTRGEVIIENNRFYHLMHPALLIEDDCNFWYESGYTKHIIFRNNEVIGCNYSNGQYGAVICYSPKVMNEDSEEFVHEKLTLTGNRFREPWYGNHILHFEYLSEAEIAGNTFDAPFEISVHKSGNIMEHDNKTV